MPAPERFESSDPFEPPVRFDFSITPHLQRDTMVAATKSLGRGGYGVFNTILIAVVTALCGLGGIAILALVGRVAGFDPKLWMGLAWIAGGTVYLVGTHVSFATLARRAADRPLARAAQVITFDQHAVTLDAGGAHWVTPWSLVDTVSQSKMQIVLAAGGIAFAVPKDVIGDTAAVSALLEQLKKKAGDA